MCGICGIAGESDPVQQLDRMLTHIRHRGPDDSGRFQSADLQVALGHQRLAILDLSPQGHQPMHAGDRRYTIVFNGEIYNFRDLRSKLQREGAQLKSHSDTEVILELYARLGPACVRELDGMFAFAIWDDQTKQLFCARDPLGIKPFYYWSVGKRLAFASEVRSLLQADLAPRRLDAEAVHRYLLYGSVQEPDTLIAGIRSLPAGHTLTWKAGQVQLDQFWSLGFGNESELDHSSAVQTVRAALEDSIARHFVSDVPVGIFLSGGIDSTAVLALAHAQKITPLSTFCIGFQQPEFDESSLAERTARHFGTEHHQWQMTAAEGIELFHDFLNCFDLPSNDGFNTYCVSRFARDNGLKVVLSGLGGDELFGGYPSFELIPKLLRSFRLASWTGGLRQLAGNILARLPVQPRLKRLASFVQSPGDLEDAYWAVRGHFSPSEANLILPSFGLDPAYTASNSAALLPHELADRIAYLESTRYMRNQLLRDSDVLSMAVGLELRTPLVDRKLWDAVTAQPAALRLRSGKRLLTDAVPEIPEWILNGRKRGFRFPFEEWTSGPWAETFASLQKRTRVPLNTWSRRWSLFVLNHFISSNHVG